VEKCTSFSSQGRGEGGADPSPYVRNEEWSTPPLKRRGDGTTPLYGCLFFFFEERGLEVTTLLGEEA